MFRMYLKHISSATLNLRYLEEPDCFVKQNSFYKAV